MARRSARRTEAAELAAGQMAFGEMVAASKTAPCVPALRETVNRWRAGGYEGATRTSRELLNHWFHADHKLPTGQAFSYHYFQREAVETLIYLWEVEEIRTRTDLLEQYARTANLQLPKYDQFARYAVK